MSDMELKERILAIMDTQSKRDGQLRTAWTGNPDSVESVEIKSIHLMTISAEYRKRESRRERKPASEPWGSKAEPSSIDKWDYFQDWLTGWDQDSWKEADEFWEKCSDCDGNGNIECVLCDGRGKIGCIDCEGTGIEE